MTSSYDKSAAIVVLPPVGGGRLRSPQLRAWLARADILRREDPAELLSTILAELDRPCPEAGLGALRMWGQTGDRPTVWIAGADPVYLEPRLDHVCLHALRGGDLPASDLRPIVDHLQRTLGEAAAFGFARVGSCGYLTAQAPIATAGLPAYVINQRVPNDFMPCGDGADGHRSLTSEIEMAVHEHEVNVERQDKGLQPVNSMWLWGGGYAPEQTTEPSPPLFCDDPLVCGYWKSRTAVEQHWPGNIAACLEAAVAGFVAVTPESDDDVDLLEACLFELRQALGSKRLSRLILLFRDGIRADVRRSQAVRIWRRRHEFLDAPPGAGG